jgi:(1->4)-alpha-D-glucan 1-alpha-D-glucosylmutase
MAVAPDEALHFVLRWQQLTGPVMAKGVEDTALYNYHPLAAVNEVGGDPADPITSTERLHEFLSARARSAPATMNATATHDTKRGEDARVRLDVLSELPDEWDELLAAWAAHGRARPRGRYRGAQKPSAADDILLLQTLIATWPLGGPPDAAYAARIHEYVIKAARESQERTSWRDPVAGYERVLARRVDEWLFAAAGAPLRDRVQRIASRVALPGALNALAQVALKATAPGVADFYQGTELWSFALVDPDNRRPVDFDLRAAMLSGLEPMLREPTRDGVESLLRGWVDGRVKLFITAAALAHRYAHRTLFECGHYLPLSVDGDRADHAAAFARVRDGRWSLTVVARWLSRLLAATAVAPHESAWMGSTIRLPVDAPRAWRSVFTGETLRTDGGALPVARALGPLPCAILYAAG